MSHKITRRGFTLIELIVALTLFGLVTGAIYGVLRTNQLTYQRQVAQIDMNNTARTTLSVLRSDLRTPSCSCDSPVAWHRSGR